MMRFSMQRLSYGIYLLLISSSSALAHPQPPGDHGGDPDVPITGIEILIGAGGALGVKKMLDKKKRKDSAD